MAYVTREQAGAILKAGGQVSFTPSGIQQVSAPSSGGGGSTLTAGQLVDIEREKGQAEAVRQAQGGASFTTETISAETISQPMSQTQMEADTLHLGQSVVSAYQPEKPIDSTYQPYKDLTFGQKVKTIFSGIPASAKKQLQAFTGTGEYQAPTLTLQPLFQPFQIFSSAQRGEISTQIPYRGTEFGKENIPIDYRKTTAFERLNELGISDSTRQPIEQTLYEIEKKTSQKVSSEILPKYQTMVNEGKNYEDVNLAYQQEFQEKFKQGYSKEIQTNPELRQAIQYKKELGMAVEPRYPIPQALEIGAFVAGGVVAPVATSTIIGLGGASTAVSGVAEKDYTKIILGTGLLVVGAGSASTTIARQVDIEKINYLREQPSLSFGVEKIKTQYGTLTDVTSARGLSPKAVRDYMLTGGNTKLFKGTEAYSITKTRIPQFITGEGTFSVTGAKGETITRFFSFEKGRWITGKETFKIQARGQLAKPFGEIQSAYGTGQVITEKELKSFGFASLTKENERFYNILSLKPTKIRMYPVEKNIYSTAGRRTILGERGGIGFIEKLPDEGTPSLIKSLAPSGKKSSEQFLKRLYGGDAVAVTEQVAKKTITEVQPVSRTFTGIISGAGTIQKKQTRTSNIQRVVNIISPMQLTKQQQKQTSVYAPIQTTQVTTIPREEQKPVVITRQQNAQQTAQRSRSGFRQVLQNLTSTIPAFASSIFTPVPPIYAKSPTFGLSESSSKSKKKKKKRKTAYQPSVSAVQLGIIGKPEKIITGAEIRGYAPEKGTKSYAKRINKFLMG